MAEIYFKILAAVTPAIVLVVILLRNDKRPVPTGWLLDVVGLGILVGIAVLPIWDGPILKRIPFVVLF